MAPASLEWTVEVITEALARYPDPLDPDDPQLRTFLIAELEREMVAVNGRSQQMAVAELVELQQLVGSIHLDTDRIGRAQASGVVVDFS